MLSAPQLGWMEWHTPYDHVNEFDKPENISATFENDAEDVVVVETRTEAKKHAACDECRTRKLKCSGESSGCSRCRKHSLTCHYSVQKQMGRPRKRRREEENSTENMTENPHVPESDVDTIPIPIQPYNAVRNADLQAFANFNPNPGTPGLMTSLPMGIFDPALQAFLDSTSDPSNGDGSPHFNTNSNTSRGDSCSWPDFAASTTSYPSHPTLPQMYPNQDFLNSQLPTPPPPQCSCLPTLYLTLASLQAHTPSFPGSLIALRAATANATSVLRCETCPMLFTSGLQNVMLLGTLIPVIVSTYKRLLAIVRDADSIPASQRTITIGEIPTSLLQFENLLVGVVGAEHPWGAAVEIPPDKWAELCRRAVQREMYGSENDDIPPPGEEKTGIMGIANEMEARQHRWHKELHPKCIGHPDHVGPFNPDTPDSGVGMGPKKGALCLRIVENIRRVAMQVRLELGLSTAGLEFSDDGEDDL